MNFEKYVKWLTKQEMKKLTEQGSILDYAIYDFKMISRIKKYCD
jgi:hypothetical protein